ncbi:hypothetical protein OA174_07225, partial [Actinomycetota bacterium]|nr:hypothetical protein [Actinomycetota bacterium]
ALYRVYTEFLLSVRRIRKFDPVYSRVIATGMDEDVMFAVCAAGGSSACAAGARQAASSAAPSADISTLTS